MDSSSSYIGRPPSPSFSISSVGQTRGHIGKFVGRLDSQQREIEELRQTCDRLMERCERLERWKAQVSHWMLEYFGDDFPNEEGGQGEGDNRSEEEGSDIGHFDGGGDGDGDYEEEGTGRTFFNQVSLAGDEKGVVVPVPVIDTVYSVANTPMKQGDVVNTQTRTRSLHGPSEWKKPKFDIDDEEAGPSKDINGSHRIGNSSSCSSSSPRSDRTYSVPGRIVDSPRIRLNVVKGMALHVEHNGGGGGGAKITKREVLPNTQQSHVSASEKLEQDEDEPCAVCGSPDAEFANTIIFCDKCNVAVHQACYGVPTVPAGKWFCNPCRMKKDTKNLPCRFCPIKGGALKPVQSPSRSSWAHVYCVWWIPEVRMGDSTMQEPVIGVSKIDKLRSTLKCKVCKKRGGAPIQCILKRCKTAFHPSCAKRAQYKMDIKDPGGCASPIFYAYCNAHRNKDVK